MPGQPLTIVSLLRDPALAQACGQWLREGPYRMEALDPRADPVELLEGKPESFDAVLLEQGVLEAE